jgi:pimeloyl-ACP methyl ester carboxylesterase
VPAPPPRGRGRQRPGPRWYKTSVNRPEVVEFGGDGPAILLLHGLMGRASTWWPVAEWLTRYGRVVGVDARAHGRNPHRTPTDTAGFAADLVALVAELDLAPAVVIGHSMGGLHGLALAAAHPELVRALVIEDMAVDQRGRTVRDWRPLFESWPVPFRSQWHVREFFGPQGDYFAECVEERADGYHLIADLDQLYPIAAEWGRESYWPLLEALRCPLLLIEPEHSLMPAGQLAEMAARAADARHLLVPGAGHLVHADAAAEYRGAVEAFLSEVLDR